MRKVVVHMQTTLNNRIAKADGTFWEPFPWGEEETAYTNQFFRAADTWAMGRRTLPPTDDRVVVGGDIAAELAALKRQDGKNIILSGGPATLAPLASAPGLIDEYLIVVHPAVIAAGPRLFEDLSTDLALSLIEAKVFDGGAVVLRYQLT
jgi:dihydrofolate reductase